MTALTDYPPEVVATARAAHLKFCHDGSGDTLTTIIADAIMFDREGRRQTTGVGLTAHQRRVVDYLSAFIGEHGVSPSYEQIQSHLGLASKSGVHRVVAALEKRGAIRRLPGHARSIIPVSPTSQGVTPAVFPPRSGSSFSQPKGGPRG